MLKDVLQWSIISVVVIHFLMLVLSQIPVAVGFWGLLMQLIYYQYLGNFPFVNHKSLLFAITICKYLIIFSFLSQYQIVLLKEYP